MNVETFEATCQLALRGFRLLRESITPEAEQEMISRIIQAFGKTSVRSNENDRSRLMRFGYDYTTEERWLRHAPQWLYHHPLTPDQFESVTVNEYQPGHGINPHVDSLQFSNEIFILNLGSSAAMAFHGAGDTRIEAFIPQRSLTLLSGDMRINWKHSIPARLSDIDSDGKEVTRGTRYSIVYRHRRGAKPK